jgi:arylsulfatase
MDVRARPNWFADRNRVTLYPEMVRLPEGSGPKTNNVNHTITVAAEIPKGGAEAVLVCLGGDTAGWSPYVRDRHLVYHYNWFDLERYEVIWTKVVPEGKVELRLEFEIESEKPGAPRPRACSLTEKRQAKD